MSPRPDGDVIELVGRVVVRVDEPAARDLELAHELEVPALGDVEHLARVHQPPHGHGAVVLDDRARRPRSTARPSATSAYVRKLTSTSALCCRGGWRDRARRSELEAVEPATARRRSRRSACSRPIEGDGNPTADLEFTLRRRLGELHRAHARRDRRARRRLRCELLNRHDTHTQTLMPMSGDAIVVVAPRRRRLLRRRALRHGAGVRAAAAHVCASAPRHLALGPVSRRRRRAPHLQHPGPRLRRTTTASRG